jgi:hypothetical protein
MVLATVTIDPLRPHCRPDPEESPRHGSGVPDFHVLFYLPAIDNKKLMDPNKDRFVQHFHPSFERFGQ